MKYSNWKRVLIEYIKNNYKEYLLVCILFLIGLFIGVMIINYSNENIKIEIVKYISDFIDMYKKVENVNQFQLTTQSIKKNLLFAVILWIGGTTVIGLPIVLISILIRGIILGFTLASITITFGTIKGIMFCMTSLVLHNIIYIPTVLTIGVSSIKLYKSIVKDKRKDNIKIEILRHTIISIIMMILLVLSAIIENYVTLRTLKKIIKYF